jgi:outer membrane lipoprotein-sorting protein
MQARPLLCLLAALAFGGCASSIKTYDWKGEQAAVQTLSQRAQSIHSVRATGTLVLTSADNQHVTLDAAIVAQIPLRASGGGGRVFETGGGESAATGEDRTAVSLRIRTWKFGQAIFDLTAKPEGIWIASDSGRDAEPKSDDRLRSLKPETISQAWNLFFGDFFSRPGLTYIDTPGRTFSLERHDNGTTIDCDVDRATLTARQYRITDDHGRVRQTLTLARYQELGEPPTTTPWPMLIIANGDEGQVQVRFDEVEVNPELEEAVFTPPKRAVKQP